MHSCISCDACLSAWYWLKRIEPSALLQASVDLADEILAAAKSNQAAFNALRRSPKVAAYEQEYWAAMSNGTGEEFTGAYRGLGVGLRETLADF